MSEAEKVYGKATVDEFSITAGWSEEELLRRTLRDLILSKVRCDDLFDDFEYFLALVHADLKNDHWVQLAAFSGDGSTARGEEWSNSRKRCSSLEASGDPSERAFSEVTQNGLKQ